MRISFRGCGGASRLVQCAVASLLWFASPVAASEMTAPIEQLDAGLNLTVASGFAQLLGGRMLFEDTPGGGLTVAIELPIVGAPKGSR